MSAQSAHKKRHLIQYAILALPIAIAGLPIYVHAPEFYASHIGASLTSIGLILLILRFVDAVQDPFIGMISDRLHAYRHYIIGTGMIMLAVGFRIVFSPWAHYPLAGFALGILICTTGLSIVSINFQALGGLWKAKPAERTRITGWREAVGLIGILIASIAPTLLGRDDNPAAAFNRLTLLYIPLIVLCGFVFFRWMRRVFIQNKPVKSPKSLSFLRLYTPWSAQFFAIYLFNNFAGAIPAILVVFFVSDRIDGASMIGLFLALYFLSGACTMPVWQWLAKRYGKERAWIAATWLAAGTFIWALTLTQGDYIPYAVICMMSGLALGADLAIPPALIADHIERKGDQNAASRYFSILTFLSKTAIALATGITLPLLEQLGYQPGNTTDYSTTVYLSVAYALIPSVLKALVALWLWRWYIGQKTGKIVNQT